MAHVQRRCSSCRRSVPEGRRTCPACGERQVSYVARYVGPDHRERSRSFARKTDAERWLTAVESSKMRGDWTDPLRSRTPLAEWSERWMATSQGLKPKTRAGYQSLLRTHVLPAFGPLPLGQIEHEAVQAWVAGLAGGGLSPSRTRQAYQVLAAMLRAAVRSGYLSRSPAEGVTLPRPVRREMRFLSASEVERLAQATPERYRALVYVLAYGGLRWGEAAALRRGRCDLLRGRLEVAESVAEVGRLYFGPTKTYQARGVATPRFLRDLLAEHLARSPGGPEALVFTAPDGGPLRHGNFRRRVWIPAVASAGLPAGLRIHDLRHTCAALLVAQGAHPKAIQAHLGHSSITVTLDQYGHLFPDEMERLAEALDAARAVSATGAGRDTNGTRVLPLPVRGAGNPV